ncbi:hypothetical protein PV749_28815 [Streptomyces sp. ID03-2B]|uniref:hypothetical protein n=1 Tax=Streptomyces sp. ID03-2B TaxID=3028660 RepID=UPI0029AFA905|nr:hypothetical protein [Streptomyces sp. ID03-2B]MDX3595136.1 hypothetical protein [Streptomyces sp. ID03-2B]
MATATVTTDTKTVKKLIATALFAGAFATGTAMTAPEELTSRTSGLPAADALYDLLQEDTVDTSTTEARSAAAALRSSAV